MLASRAVNRLPPPDIAHATRSALRCLLGALVVFVLNLGSFGNAVVRDVNKTDEAACQSGASLAHSAWGSAAPGDDTPDPLTPAASAPAQANTLAAMHSWPPASPHLATLRRGPSARAPPLLG